MGTAPRETKENVNGDHHENHQLDDGHSTAQNCLVMFCFEEILQIDFATDINSMGTHNSRTSPRLEQEMLLRQPGVGEEYHSRCAHAAR